MSTADSLRGERTPPETVAVVGAGVAGAAVAHALRQRGIAVTVFDSDAPGAGASGNAAAVFRPLLARADTHAVRLTHAAMRHNLANWPNLAGLKWSRCGVLHCAKNPADAERQSQMLAFHTPEETEARAVDHATANHLAGVQVAAGGLFFSQGGWVVPQTLIAAWLAGCTLRCPVAVARVDAKASGVQLVGAGDAGLGRFDAVVLANAYQAAALAPECRWPLARVRGQITRVRAPPATKQRLQTVVASEGYVLALGDDWLIGATYEHDVLDTLPRAAGDTANLARLAGLLPGVDTTAVTVVDQRAALRATLPDRLPMLGAVPGRPGVFVAAGYASRGVVWAGVLGEALAAMVLGDAPLLDAGLMRALSPARFERG